MKKSFLINIKNIQETKKLADFFVKNLNKPAIICLRGEVGVGKTQFVKFFANSLKIPDVVVSPTFTKMQIYSINKKENLIHLDGYRLNVKSDLGFFKDHLNETYIIIEWPKVFLKYLDREKIINLFFKYKPKEKRTIKIESCCKILDKLKDF